MTSFAKILRYTQQKPWAKKTVDRIGQGLKYVTRGRYRVGLSRLAVLISDELRHNEKIYIRDGAIYDSEGYKVIEHPLLRVGKDFGQLPQNSLFRDHWNVASFLRSHYLKPERWNNLEYHISIHAKFHGKQNDFLSEFRLLNERLGINSLFGIKVKIRPINWFDRLSWRIFKDRYQSGDNESNRPSAAYNFNYISFRGSIVINPKFHEEQFLSVLLHEYVHHLKYLGIIRNDSTAETIGHLRRFERYGSSERTIKVIKSPPVFDGYFGSLGSFFRRKPKIYMPESLDCDESYRIGRNLAGLTWFLFNETNFKWRFINLLTQSISWEELKKAVEKDPRLNNFM